MSIVPTAGSAAADVSGSARGPAGGRLVVRTAQVPDPGPLLDAMPRHGGMAWLRRGEGLIGWGEVARVRTAGDERFAHAGAWWAARLRHAVVRDEVRLPGTGPVAFGSFAFSGTSASGGVLIVPAVVLGRRGDTWWLTTATTDGVPDGGHLDPAEPPRPPGRVVYRDGALTARRWQRAVATAVDEITAGRLDKVVLARDLQARASASVDPRWLLTRLADRYPRCWSFAVDGLVGATPEMLVRTERGLVTSRVLAGTIQRSADDLHDMALAASLARSSKDLEEHEYAVRSVAEALQPYCSSMNVPESPFVLHLPNVMHLATDVTGVVSPAAGTSLDLAAALHPSAAVCGTPTLAAASLIADLEGMDRDRYAGPVGWLDGSGDGEWALALRCGRIDPDDDRRLRLFAGCGIVAGSDPADELAESIAKLVPMREALSRP